MKKYALMIAVSALFCGTQLFTASNEKKQIATNLSAKDETELRKAVSDYKKGILMKADAQVIINKYAKKYPKDSLVKAKLHEKMRFDNENL